MSTVDRVANTRLAAPADPGTAPWSGLRTWPLRRPAVWFLAWAGALMVAAWSVAGLAYKAIAGATALGEADRDAAEWFEGRRTATLDDWSHVGSMLSEVYVKVALVALAAAVFAVAWRRWHDAAFIATIVIFEASVFALTSIIVRRDRPPVVQLDNSAPTGSFPSGHAAASVAFYSGLLMVAAWHTVGRTRLRVLLGIAISAALAVGVSRAYRGMHHPSDVIAGWALGVVSLFVVRHAFERGADDIRRRDGDERPAHVQQLDLTPSAERAGAWSA